MIPDRNIKITIVDTDKNAKIENCFHCYNCRTNYMCNDAAQCRLVKYITERVPETKYNIKSNLYTLTVPVAHDDFIRARQITRRAIKMRMYRVK